MQRCLRYDKEIGVFTFRFSSPDDQRPRWLLLDDLIVCDLQDPKKFIFCHSSEPNELWTIFLEKAFSKWMGGYMNCRGGVQNIVIQCCEPMQALSFGMKSLLITTLENKHWKELLGLQDKHWIVKAAAKPIKNNKFARDPITGLVGFHQFSVLDFYELKLENSSDKTKKSFCHNFVPWLERIANNEEHQSLPPTVQEDFLQHYKQQEIHIYNETNATVAIDLSAPGCPAMSLELHTVHTHYTWKIKNDNWRAGNFAWREIVDVNTAKISNKPPRSGEVRYAFGDSIYLKKSGQTVVRNDKQQFCEEQLKAVNQIKKSAAFRYWESCEQGSSGASSNHNVLRLVKLRNPWGFGEWTGLWSDKSLAWYYFTDVCRKVFKTKDGKPVIADDGTFFMQWADFVHHFENVIATGEFSDPGFVDGAPVADFFGAAGGSSLTAAGKKGMTAATRMRQKHEKKKLLQTQDSGTSTGFVEGDLLSEDSLDEDESDCWTDSDSFWDHDSEDDFDDFSDDDSEDDDDDSDFTDDDFSERDYDDDDEDDRDHHDDDLVLDIEPVQGKGHFSYPGPDPPTVEILGHNSSLKHATALACPGVFRFAEHEGSGRIQPEEFHAGTGTLAFYVKFPFEEALYDEEKPKQIFEIVGLGYQGPCTDVKELTVSAVSGSGSIVVGSSDDENKNCRIENEEWPFWFDDWMWVAVTYDRTSVKLYVEGSLTYEKDVEADRSCGENEDSLLFATGPPDLVTVGITEADELVGGGSKPKHASYPGMQLQGVAFWDRVLTEEELGMVEKKVVKTSGVGSGTGKNKSKGSRNRRRVGKVESAAAVPIKRNKGNRKDQILIPEPVVRGSPDAVGVGRQGATKSTAKVTPIGGDIDLSASAGGGRAAAGLLPEQKRSGLCCCLKK
ncbi:unnamed protein product [Amoebophrya sp. A120]|nr:unnamed protein product [Amoebophrya sp. A120]|eukprot:GSA120T00007611001.1